MAFTDAVVAIAMTLLILPLMESVSEAARDGLSTWGWFEEHGAQVGSFLLSFLLIGTYWMSHHQLGDRLAGYSRAMVVANFAWMLSIVWLPVPTAMVGQMPTTGPEGRDSLQVALYIGSMLFASMTYLALQVLARYDARLWRDDAPPPAGGLIAAIVLAVLTAIALVVALTVPPVDYLALLLLMLTAPLVSLLRPWLGPRLDAAARARAAASRG